MRPLIVSDVEKCKGCNRCTRVCPVEEANITYLEGDKIKIRIDNDKCIACGACISVCQHDSRDYIDDTEQFFAALRAGERISLIVAPAVRTNFDDWASLLAWLRTQGVQTIVDVSLGADICTWAHIRYIQQENPAPLITQPCPAIVNYIEHYQPNLLPQLSPVHSPMLCAGVFMRKHLGVNGQIAALSPCIAKSHEFDATGIISYNVTFKKLAEYIARHNIRIPKAPFQYDHLSASLGGVYSMPGGLKENVEFYLDKALRIDKSEGQGIVYKHLDEFAAEKKQNLPAIFDVLNCQEGCNLGTACNHEASPFKINRIMDETRQSAMQKYQKTDKEKFTKLFELFDNKLNLNDYLRKYTAQPIYEIPYSEADVEQVMQELGKTTEEQRNHNCYACGCETCHSLAVRIAKGINVTQNCMEKARAEIAHEHDALLLEQEQSSEYLGSISTEISSIQQLFETVLSGVESMEQVISQYSQMAKIVDDIAMQTQLLSLNASVEAVRAGNAGKGFAVVAQSIRELANKSQESINNVSGTSEVAQKTINSITSSSKDVDKSISRVSSYIDEITRSLRKAEFEA
ncbi:methyl-accepting chemotaxis protein [Clostridia bacterium OttesenSCG-928-F22]|nr:methyl-accepting chemotaxis protein [Clostridia bacterium OttesenSCG-928-F22]